MLIRELNEIDWQWYERHLAGIHREDIEMFIIPNIPSRVIEKLSRRGRFYTFNSYSAEKVEDVLKFYGTPCIDLDDYLIQIWCKDTKNETPIGGHSNLSDHGYTLPDSNELYRFPTEIPLSLIKGLKEGDALKIHGYQGSFTLTARQLGNKYTKEGPFEVALENLLERARQLDIRELVSA